MKIGPPPLLRALVFSGLIFTCRGLAAPAQLTLLELAREHFAQRPFTEAEEKLFIAVEKGERASMLAENESENDPSAASTWPASRMLRADTLAWLCTDPAATAKINYRGVLLAGMLIQGELNLSETKLNLPFFATKCAFDGDLYLSGARLRWFVLNGSVIKNLTARHAQFDADVSFSEGFVAKGKIDLTNSTIAGNLFCGKAQFEDVLAEQARIGGTALLRYSQFKSVNFLAATIGESLECDGTRLANPGQVALLIERATIKGSVFLRAGDRNAGPSMPSEKVPFQAEGQVNLLAAIIHGSLECTGARLSHPPPNKALLLADRAKITGQVLLQDHFRCDGLADFKSCEGSYLYWTKAEATEKTVVNLESAHFGTIWSDDLAWVRRGNLHLDGFVYSRLLGGMEDNRENLFHWLSLQPSKQFHPQPYEQLAAVLKATGRETDAREILLEKNRQHRKAVKSWGEWWWYNVFGRAIGYGYLPSRAFVMSLGFILIGAVLFKIGYAWALIAPAKESAYSKEPATAKPASNGRGPIAESYPRFNALVYSLESFTPLLKLDQISNWAPNANRGTRFKLGWINFTTGSLLRVYLWCHIILGWILTSLWVGSITGLVKT